MTIYLSNIQFYKLYFLIIIGIAITSGCKKTPGSLIPGKTDTAPVVVAPPSKTMATEYWIEIGQSNMAGTHPGQEFPAAPNVYVLPQGGRWGPGYAFASIRAAQKNIQIILIPCAVGGTSSTQWLPGTTLFQECIDSYRSFSSKPLTGILAWQGESDAVDGPAGIWASNFQQTIASFKEQLQSPGIPTIFVRLGTLAIVAPYLDDVKQQQTQCSLLKDYYMATCDGLENEMLDTQHYNYDGLWSVGQRMAQAYSK